MAEYGHLNDVIYVEDNSYLTVRGSNEACLDFVKMATQGLTVMRHDPLVCLDRYVVSNDSRNSVALHRALGGSEGRGSLFTVDDDDDDDDDESANKVLVANRAFQCIILCSASSLHGLNVSLLKNEECFIQSQLCGDSGCGSHCLNGVLDLDEGDRVKLRFRSGPHDVSYRYPSSGSNAVTATECKEKKTRYNPPVLASAIPSPLLLFESESSA
ncbi:hypothetical protein ACHAWO_001378 [Cyclotella atomus]|uniref:Uncharacterized protein n=1 Tax=Cyclotella atomus TaxID=382360 RepID=A0ABD3QMG4_9STRA